MKLLVLAIVLPLVACQDCPTGSRMCPAGFDTSGRPVGAFCVPMTTAGDAACPDTGKFVKAKR